MSVDQKAVMMTATQKYLIPHRALGRGRRRSRSSSSRRALLRCWRGLGCDCLWFLRGFPTTSTKANLLGKPGSAFRIAGRDHRMLSGEVPAITILLNGQPMAGNQMPSEYQAAPAALQANDIIAMNGSPDRHRWCRLSLGFGGRFSESGERLMYGGDQGRELIGRDLVSPNISCDDIGSEFSIERCGGRFVSHFWLSP